MASALPLHPRVPRLRANAVERDILLIQRASATIAEFGEDLDRRLSGEPRASERLRFVRESTNRITRTANDAIQAYRRARRSLDAQVARADRWNDAPETGKRLSAARLALLAALEKANRRYPWTEPTRQQDGEATQVNREPTGG